MPAITEIEILGTIFAALLGLAFGSFLNVVLTRLPASESIVKPASHCRNCAHTLSWWENIPILSWLLLKGRCQQCQTPISPRYPWIEFSMAILWAGIWTKFYPLFWDITPGAFPNFLRLLLGHWIFVWLLIGLAALDAEHFWLPDIFTIPGILLGCGFSLFEALFEVRTAPVASAHQTWAIHIYQILLPVVLAAGVILIIRLLYWLIRRKEGMGLGDAKLMSMLGAWLGLTGALESFALAILAASAAALIYLATLAIQQKKEAWAKLPLPLGTFLCLAAIPEIFDPNWLWNWYSRTFLP